MKKLVHSSAYYHQYADFCHFDHTKIQLVLSAKHTHTQKNKRNLSFHYCFLMNYFSLHICAWSNPIPRLLNRMPFCIYSFRLITCSFEYFSLITLFFHHVVPASSALLILSVCVPVSSFIYTLPGEVLSPVRAERRCTATCPKSIKNVTSWGFLILILEIISVVSKTLLRT